MGKVPETFAFRVAVGCGRGLVVVVVISILSLHSFPLLAEVFEASSPTAQHRQGGAAAGARLT